MALKILLRTALTVSLLLCGLVWSYAADSSLGEGQETNRVLRGGLGYDFSLTWEKARTLGFSPSKKRDQSGQLSKLASGEFFPIQTLFFTVKSKKLLKIQGARPEGEKAACAKDYVAVMDGVKNKYPSLKSVQLSGSSPPFDSYLCERTSRYEGPAGAFIGDKMEGRCIKLQCLGDSRGHFLMIEYWDMDLYDSAQREHSEWQRENRERIMQEKGFDPKKL